ncbi:MAG TPA: response regulator transcription factor [Terriglobia bacterium]|nr:response regulator transcription factor [Terriglobia bacterium]
MNNPYRAVPIVIGAEDPIVRYGIRRLLETEPGFAIAGEAADRSATLRLIQTLRPEVLLLDLALSGQGFGLLEELAAGDTELRIILLAAAPEKSQTAEALRRGAHGVLQKYSATQLLLHCVRSVAAGRYWTGKKPAASLAEALHEVGDHANGQRLPKTYGLTPRELDIVSTIVTGCSNKDLGQKFSISERTVKHHLSNIFGKLGVSNRLELAVFALSHHLEDAEPKPARSPEQARDREAQYQEA